MTEGVVAYRNLSCFHFLSPMYVAIKSSGVCVSVRLAHGGVSPMYVENWCACSVHVCVCGVCVSVLARFHCLFSYVCCDGG